MYVQITGGRRVKKLLPPSRKQLTITETNTILQRLETFAEDTGIKDTIRIKLVKDKDVLFRDDCIIGEGISRNLLLVVQHTFTTLYGNTNSTECVELITTIQQELENPEVKELANNSKKMKLKKERKQKKIHQNNRYFSVKFLMRRSTFFMIMGVLLLSLIGVSLFFANFYLKKEQIPPKPTYEQLLQEGKYLEAAEAFPDNLEAIEQYLVEKQEFQELKTLNERFPTNEGTFDLAFYQKEWKKVIQTEVTELNTDRKVMLAYAYIQLERLEEAEILNKTLKSKQLTTELNKAWIRKAIRMIRKEEFLEAEKINNNLKNDQLGELIETGKTCQEMVSFYREKKDTKNETLWKNRLSQLGEEFYNENE
ncbi:response regulator [Enterococcus faecalis]|nr:response regulator [Enterococcus faecalis]EKQ3613431.1 response regulator [Enterococcus faecalis]